MSLAPASRLDAATNRNLPRAFPSLPADTNRRAQSVDPLTRRADSFLGPAAPAQNAIQRETSTRATALQAFLAVLVGLVGSLLSLLRGASTQIAGNAGGTQSAPGGKPGALTPAQTGDPGAPRSPQAQRAKASSSEKPQKGGSSLAAKVLAEARRHLGFREGAGNSNPFSRALGRPAEAWCADFVSYVFKKAGVKHVNTASVQTLADHLRARKEFHRGNPRPGDIVIFGGNQHTGIVEKVFRKNGQTYIQTIEGNASNSVRRNTYPVSSSRITGFGTVR